jgi:hypothetical protein
LSITATPFEDTTRVLPLVHPLAKVDIFLFINDFHPKMEITLDQKTFIFALACSQRLSSSCPLDMVYELL